ncbi:zinc ribbon domain-containing protein [uncultured Clostridium sp.]|jgi:hypothetical protein|uniref:zinc ribbon domain-containing protein n=1 Tax=uncultured Clostridium sp. TaxID=59620 RepID=UPI00261928CB|nr:zinc ribbon domain-containing protein [uncultured Clostridium sp.]
MIDFIIMFMPIIAFIIAILVLTLLIGVTVWVYKDAKRRGANAFFWAVVTLLVNQAFIGFIIYLLVGRKNRQIECENCGEKIDIISKFCNYCGAILEVDNSELIKKDKKTNKIIVNLVKGIVLVFLIFIVGMIGFASFQMVTTSSSSVDVKASFLDKGKYIDSGYSFASLENQTDEKWTKRSVREVSDRSVVYDIENPEFEKVLVNYSQKSGSAYIVITQGNIEEEFDITNLNNYDLEPLKIDLSSFEVGKIDIRVIMDTLMMKFKLKKTTKQ